MSATIGTGDPRASVDVLAVCAQMGAQVSLVLGAVLAKGLFPTVGAEGTITIRLFLGAAILSLIFRPWTLRVGTTWRLLLAYGTAIAVMTAGFYKAVSYIPIGPAIALELCGPLCVAVLGSRRRIDLVWTGLAIVGVAVLLPIHGAGLSALDMRGVAFALFAGAGWAAYVVTGKRAGQEHGPRVVGAGAIVAAVLCTPWGLLHAGASLLRPEVLARGLGLGAASSAIPFALEMISLRRLSPSVYGTLVCTGPATGVIIGLLLLGETLSPAQWSAIALIICASVGATLNARSGSVPETA